MRARERAAIVSQGRYGWRSGRAASRYRDRFTLSGTRACRRASARDARAPQPGRREQRSAASRAASSRSTSASRSAKRSIGTPLWRAPSSSPGPRSRRSWRAISKPSLVLVDDLQALARGLRTADSDRAGCRCSSPAPRPTRPAQLVQLRKPHALGVLDHHQRRVRHVDADFDHRGRDQQLDLAALERVP